jgi:hypothetical protein
MDSADLTPTGVKGTLEKLTGLQLRGAISCDPNAKGGIAYRMVIGLQTLLAKRRGDDWIIALGDHVEPTVIWTTMMTEAHVNSTTVLEHVLDSFGVSPETAFIVEQHEIETDVARKTFSTHAGTVRMHSRRIDAGTELIVQFVNQKRIFRYLHRRDGTLDLGDVTELRRVPF